MAQEGLDLVMWGAVVMPREGHESPGPTKVKPLLALGGRPSFFMDNNSITIALGQIFKFEFQLSQLTYTTCVAVRKSNSEVFELTHFLPDSKKSKKIGIDFSDTSCHMNVILSDHPLGFHHAVTGGGSLSASLGYDPLRIDLNASGTIPSASDAEEEDDTTSDAAEEDNVASSEADLMVVG